MLQGLPWAVAGSNGQDIPCFQGMPSFISALTKFHLVHIFLMYLYMYKQSNFCSHKTYCFTLWLKIVYPAVCHKTFTSDWIILRLFNGNSLIRIGYVTRISDTKRCGRKHAWPFWGYYSSIFLKGLNETAKPISKFSRFRAGISRVLTATVLSCTNS